VLLGLCRLTAYLKRIFGFTGDNDVAVAPKTQNPSARKLRNAPAAEAGSTASSYTGLGAVADSTDRFHSGPRYSSIGMATTAVVVDVIYTSHVDYNGVVDSRLMPTPG
jgi:hypothetical protein